MDASIDILERLLGDHAVDFFAATWRRRFLHLPGAAAAFLDAMPTLAEVDARLAGLALDDASSLPVFTFPPGGAPIVRALRVGTARPLPVDEAQNLPHADASFPALRPLAQGLARRFAAPVNLQLFRARRGLGLRPHSDVHDSFILQIVGRKRWRIEDPAPDRLPPGNAGGDFGPAARTVDLAPGDLLYRPSHGVHATESLDDDTLSLSATVGTLTAADALLRWIAAAAALDPIWRTRLPATDAERAALDAALHSLRPRAHDLAEIPARVADDLDDTDT